MRRAWAGLLQGRRGCWGVQQGEATLLIKLLERRFGVLPAWAHQQIEQSEKAALEAWGLRLLEAGSLEEVFRE